MAGKPFDDYLALAGKCQNDEEKLRLMLLEIAEKNSCTIDLKKPVLVAELNGDEAKHITTISGSELLLNPFSGLILLRASVEKVPPRRIPGNKIAFIPSIGQLRDKRDILLIKAGDFLPLYRLKKNTPDLDNAYDEIKNDTRFWKSIDYLSLEKYNNQSSELRQTKINVPKENKRDGESKTYANHVDPDIPKNPSNEKISTDYSISTSNEYISYLKSRNVKYLIHFTPVENINSIMKNGLQPRAEQSNKGKTTDSLRLDSKLDALSISISFPNYQMFYKKRIAMADTNFVIMLIAVETLDIFSHNQIAFYSSNAANSESTATSFQAHCNLDSLKAMFVETAKRKKDLPKQYTTDPQAEIMIKGTIPPKYIVGMVFENTNMLTVYRNKYNCSCRADASLFKYRSDYDMWLKQDNNSGGLTENSSPDESDDLPF